MNILKRLFKKKSKKISITVTDFWSSTKLRDNGAWALTDWYWQVIKKDTRLAVLVVRKDDLNIHAYPAYSKDEVDALDKRFKNFPIKFLTTEVSEDFMNK